MTVTVKLHTTLKKFAPEGSQGGVATLEVTADATARTIVEALGIPEDFVGAVFLGAQRGEMSSALSEGVEVNLLAPIGGG